MVEKLGNRKIGMTIFAKIRYILFTITLLGLIFAVYIYTINVFEILILIFSFLIFVINKKWTDYIAFSIFTFWLVVIITFEINSCLYFFELGCSRYLYLSLITPRISMMWLLLFSSIWIYLILSFVKRIK